MSIHRDDELARKALKCVEAMNLGEFYDAVTWRSHLTEVRSLLTELAERLEARRDAEITGKGSEA